MFETVRISSLEEKKEQNDFCMLSENFVSSLHIDYDDFVWMSVSKGSPDRCTSVVVTSHDIQEECYERSTVPIEAKQRKNKAHSNNGSIIMPDFNKDFSYDQHQKQFESVTKKVSHKKRRYTRQRQRQSTFCKTIIQSENNESNYPIFNTFDRPTTEILKSIVNRNNYYTGQFGNVIRKGANSIVLCAYINIKRYPTWEPGAKPDLIYAYINNKFNKRYHMWRSAVKAVKVYKVAKDNIKNERIYQKVQKEKDHLLLLHKAKSNVPEVMRSSRNVIVMSMIGTDQETAPSVTSVPLNRCQVMYHTIVKDMEMWYNLLHLVHGKLSLKNILYWKDQIYYLGWSHSVRREHPLALKKLMRDCFFVTKFFEKRLVRVKPAERLFQDITGLDRIGSVVLSLFHSKSKDLWKTRLLINPNRTDNGFDNIHSLRNCCRFKW